MEYKKPENEPLLIKKLKPEKDPKEKLSIYTKLIYGFPSLPFSIGINIYSTYVFKYYTDTVGVDLNLLNAAYIYLLFFLVFLFPVLGWVFDRTNTRFGRRRPWIVFATPILYLSCILIWLTPTRFPQFFMEFAERESLYCLWFSVFYGIAVILTFIVQTPYISWGVELTLDFDERSSLFGYSQAFYLIGVVVATGLPELCLKWFDNARNVFVVIAVVTGIIGTLTFEYMAFALKERPDFIRPKSTPLVPGIRASFLENKPFVVLLVVITFSNSAPYTLSLLPYWVEYTLQLNDLWGSVIMTVFILSGFLFIPFWNWLARIWGKRKAYASSLVLSFIGYSLMIYPQKNQLIMAIVFSAISGASGIFLTNSNFLYQSLQGDVMDYDEFRTGMRREALYNNIMQFFNWYMSAFSTSIPFILLAKLGFNADAVQSERVRFGLSVIVGSAGVFSLLAAIVLMIFYPITKQKYYLILEGIKQHEKGFDVQDMFSNKVIPSPSKMTSSESEVFWLLYTFAHFEIRTGIEKGVNSLKLFVILYILIWFVVFVGSCLGWYFMSNYYYIWAYVAMLAFCMVAYHIMRLRAAYQLQGKKITKKQMQDYLVYKKYEDTNNFVN